MRVVAHNLRYEPKRSGITIYPLPTFELILNEYGSEWQPNWKLNIRFIWFMLSVQSSKRGKAFQKEYRN